MKKNKSNIKIAIIISIAILTIGSLLFTKILKNHQANLLIAEKCFENLDKETTVAIKKEGFWSPVTCEITIID